MKRRVPFSGYTVRPKRGRGRTLTGGQLRGWGVADDVTQTVKRKNGNSLSFRDSPNSHTNEFTFSVYHVSINGNYVMGRDGGGSIINFRTS